MRVDSCLHRFKCVRAPFDLCSYPRESRVVSCLIVDKVAPNAAVIFVTLLCQSFHVVFDLLDSGADLGTSTPPSGARRLVALFRWTERRCVLQFLLRPLLAALWGLSSPVPPWSSSDKSMVSFSGMLQYFECLSCRELFALVRSELLLQFSSRSGPRIREDVVFAMYAWSLTPRRCFKKNSYQ